MAMKSLPNGKSPGPDDLPGEYYKQFQDTLAPHLCPLFYNTASSSGVPKEMLKVLVITLPKLGKSADMPLNFRPIFLLNRDLKLYPKIIATHLMEVLPSLINKDQAGFTKWRKSSDATRCLIHIIHFAECTRTPSLLLSMDAEKAFDTVNWAYLQAVLSKFGFKNKILSAITALYSTPTA